MKIALSPSNQPDNMYAGQNVSEKTMCTRFAEAARGYLQAAGHQVNLLTSSSLSSRFSASNAWGSDLHVPIHTNAGGGKGVEILVSGSGAADAFARSVAAELAAVIPSRTNRGLKIKRPSDAGGGEIYGVRAPVVYIEAEFHDNPTYAAWLVANPDAVGKAIADGIIKAAGGTPSASAPSAPSKPVSHNADGSITLTVDGQRGGHTISRWQEVMGTPIDGKISKPRSLLIGADQAYLNQVVAASHIKNLTGNSSLAVDQMEGAKTIKVRQFWLFNTVGPNVLGRAAKSSDFDGIPGKQTTLLHQVALNAAKAGSGRY